MAKTPAKPNKASESAKAKAGEPLQLQANPAQPGKYNLESVLVKGDAGEEGEGEEKKTYGIIIELEDDQGKPVLTMPSGDPVKFRLTASGQAYEGTLARIPVLMPNGKPRLGQDGKEVFKSQATVSGLPEKPCEVSFPNIHPDDWSKK